MPFRGAATLQQGHRPAQHALTAESGLFPLLLRFSREAGGEIPAAVGQGHGGELQLLAPGAHRLQHAGAVFRQQQKGGVVRPLLQQLEHGVLGGGVHLVGPLQHIDLPLPLVGADVGIGAEGAHLVHGDGLVPAGNHIHVWVYAGEHLFAGRAPMAGALSRRCGADHGGGELRGQGVPPGAFWPGDEIGVGEAPALLPLGQLLL